MEEEEEEVVVEVEEEEEEDTRLEWRLAGETPPEGMGPSAQLESRVRLAMPAGVAVHGDEVFCCDTLAHRVVVYDRRTLAPVRAVGGGASSPLEAPVGVAVHADELYVADLGARHRVAVFDCLSGEYRRELSLRDEDEGQAAAQGPSIGQGSVSPLELIAGLAIVPPGERPLEDGLCLVLQAERLRVLSLHDGTLRQVLRRGGSDICVAGDLVYLVDGHRPPPATFECHILRVADFH